MILRFFLFWIALFAVMYAWMWVIRPKERRHGRVILKRAAISALIALAVILASLTLNNISGV